MACGSIDSYLTIFVFFGSSYAISFISNYEIFSTFVTFEKFVVV